MTRKLRNHILSVFGSITVVIATIAPSVSAQSPASESSGKVNALAGVQNRRASALAQFDRMIKVDKSAGAPTNSRTDRRHVGSNEQGYPLFVLTGTYGSGGESPDSIAVADVNGDGNADLLVANSGSSTVGVLLGNGDGTLQEALSYDSGGVSDWFNYGSVATGDVNGDGWVDLVVTNTCISNDDCSSGSVGVLLGNGDGTFLPVVVYRSGAAAARSVAIADVNGDGKPDLVVANCGDRAECPNHGVLGVLLGNGDGTFQEAVTYDSGGSGSVAAVLGDVNRDGKVDIVVANFSDPVTVLLGKGDGTFTIPTGYAFGAQALALADVNLDGKLDIVTAHIERGFCDTNNGFVGVMLGNGDGTFQSEMMYDSGGCLYIAESVAAADVNGDGYPDLLVANYCASGGCQSGHAVAGVLLGYGDGGFQDVETFDTGSIFSVSLALADLNSDGAPDLVVADWAWAVAVLTNTTEWNKPKPTYTSLISSPNPSIFGQSVVLTAFVNSDYGTPTGMVQFFDGPTVVGSAALSDGNTSISVSSLATGSHSMTARYVGSAKFSPSDSAPVTQVVSTAMTTTSLESSANPVGINRPVTYTATVTSQYGGAVTGTVTFSDGSSNVATVTVWLHKASYSTSYPSVSVHSITATYSGDANNVGSTSPALTEYVANTSKTAVTTSALPNLVGEPATFTATVTSPFGAIPDGELITFYDGNRELASVALQNGNAVYTTNLLSAKTHYIKAEYVGDTTFAPSLGKLIKVVLKYRTSTGLVSNPNPCNYGQSVTFTATVTASGPYAVSGKVKFWDGATAIGSAPLNGEIAILKRSTLTVGTHAITAQYLGDAYNDKSASPVVNQMVE